MKKQSIAASLISLVIGFGLGAQSLGTAQAEEPPAPSTTSQGEVLKVCIDKKTGSMRAASKCKNTEKLYVLGGPGPQGPEGPQGEKGDTGAQGEKGDAGPEGSISGLKRKSIQLWETSLSKTCGGSLLSGTTRVFEAINPSAISTDYKGVITYNKSCSTLYATDVTVLVP
jgi:hypothetical protein